MLRPRSIVAALAVLAMGLAACGEDGGADTAESAAGESGGTVSAATTPLGETLVDSEGLTLYLFTDDVDGVSTCYDACATTWPPVSGDLAVGPSLDTALFDTVERDDSTTQLRVAGQPLYTFAGDSAPGDVNGQGSGGVWFASDPTGAALGSDAATEEPAADGDATDGVVDDELGPILTDADGMTLYAFDNDPSGASACNEPCSDTWPPVLEGEEIDTTALEAELGTITRDSGEAQLALDGRPLYRYVDDEAPGDVNGHLVGDVWFAVAADGSVIRPAAVRIGSTDAGEVLISDEGFTLYRFANDEPGVSNCYDPCSQTWPPFPADATVDATLAADQFGELVRDDGVTQLTLDGQPLYLYADDENPGDANGDGIGGVWSVVAAEHVDRVDGDAGDYGADVQVDQDGDDYGSTDGSDAGAGLGVGSTDVGDVLIDDEGFTLYAFTNDTDGQSSCFDACAGTWPPVSADLAAGEIDGVSSTTRPDEADQLVVGVWPLYRFSGDSAPGDANGHGSGGVWFAVAPDGTLIG